MTTMLLLLPLGGRRSALLLLYVSRRPARKRRPPAAGPSPQTPTMAISLYIYNIQDDGVCPLFCWVHTPFATPQKFSGSLPTSQHS